ncbi:protein glxC [Rhodopseudomonas palustris]|uniref:GltB/FmdC/FwdC-like GXGXG domain-containing protein n=1 Tax=Rhodopseudomonas palustris TaxID=1076 RepID=UPI002ACE1424|nr:protein glxC [Rhodopseudomonas palustris]WQG99412.1 protein glxC [Rhodopseudomonas palustris]
MPVCDLAVSSVRELNQALHRLAPDTNETAWEIDNPQGKHAIGVGINVPVEIDIKGHVGYYCAGMNKFASVRIHGNAGTGVAENMMSGTVHVMGDASQSAGATGCGGLLIIDGDASARCGISMKGIDILVKGSIGSMSAFMAQAGNLVVLGNAGEALGDSIYEATIFVRGEVKSLGADCIEKPMTEADRERLAGLLGRAGLDGSAKVDDFRMYGSARELYHFHVDNAASY